MTVARRAECARRRHPRGSIYAPRTGRSVLGAETPTRPSHVANIRRSARTGQSRQSRVRSLYVPEDLVPLAEGCPARSADWGFAAGTPRSARAAPWGFKPVFMGVQIGISGGRSRSPSGIWPVSCPPPPGAGLPSRWNGATERRAVRLARDADASPPAITRRRRPRAPAHPGPPTAPGHARPGAAGAAWTLAACAVPALAARGIAASSGAGRLTLTGPGHGGS